MKSIKKSRYFLLSGICAVIGSLAIAASQPLHAEVAPQANSEITKTATLPAINVADVAGHIAPHRALYTIKLASTKNGSSVSGISGRMYFSWADDCGSWNVEQKMKIRFYYSEGDVSDSSSSLVSREAKDGSSYVFHVKRSGEDDKNDITRGSATITADPNGMGPGSAVASGTLNKQFPLETATTFPAHHTMQLLANAKTGRKFFTVNVFDGADENGLNEISSFIGSPVEPEAGVKKASSDPGIDSPLLKARGWPVRMAFFAPNSQAGAPDYEMDMVLLENGVIRDMTINYDDFSMKAELVNIEALAPAKCTTPKKSAAKESITPPS